MNVISNARWVGLSQALKIILQFVGIAVLARLIPPAEYGVMAMATVVINLASILRDMGTAAAIIQKENLNEETKSTVFWFNMAIGSFLTIALLASANLIAMAFKTPQLESILYLLSSVFVVSNSASVHQALLERKSAFKTMAIIELSSAIIGLAAAIIAAIEGLGVFSLVLQAMITAYLSTIILWLASDWRPSFRWNHAEFNELFKFSGNLSAFNIINYFARNADNMIVGRYLGAHATGTYSMAYKLMLFPLQSMTFITSRALFPIMSRQQGNIEEMAALYLRAVSFVAFITAPAMTGLFVLREPFVQYCFGSQWTEVADVLFWFAPIGFIQSIVSTTGTIFMARGRTGVLFRLGVLGAILQVGAFTVGVQWGIIGVAYNYFLANIINMIPSLTLTMRQLNKSIFSLFARIIDAIVSSLLMGIVIYALRTKDFMPNNISSFFVQILVGILTYFIFSLMFQKHNCTNIINILIPKKIAS